jgi:hypothetical protein
LYKRCSTRETLPVLAHALNDAGVTAVMQATTAVNSRATAEPAAAGTRTGVTMTKKTHACVRHTTANQRHSCNMLSPQPAPTVLLSTPLPSRTICMRPQQLQGTAQALCKPT